ncbi:MAG: RibD family protein [Gemmatimonadetes bacterium]|nr:RibD family protein [Gemmatimonadota bacterium]
MAEGPGEEAGFGEVWRWILAVQPGAPASTGPLSVDGAGEWSTDVALTAEARDALDLFLSLRVRSAFVVGQLGQSLDGRIATESGHSHYINGPDDIRRLHCLRALVDAVVVGAGTVEADDPRLTVREVDGEHPARVVLDPRGRVGPHRRIFERPGPPVLWMRGSGAGVGPSADGVDVEGLPLDEAGGFDPNDVVRSLARRGWRRVLVEGGGVTVSRFLQAGALDRLHVSVAPLILGSGRPAFTLPTIRTLDEGLRPPVRHFRLGTDVLFDLDLGG